MNCNDFENLVMDYLENTVSDPLRRQMESHLLECDKCRVLAGQEKLVMEQLNKIQIEICPDEIINHVMESISSPRMSVKDRILEWLEPLYPRHRFASVTGSIVIILMVLFIYIPGHHRKTIDDIAYTSDEIKQATVDAKLALAYFSVYSRKTESALKKIDLVDPVIKPIEDGFKKAMEKIPYI